MENISKYIGIPHIFSQSSFEAADCVGLVRLWFKEHQWKPSCYDGEFTKDWYEKDPLRMVRYLTKNFYKVKDVSELHLGDIVYFCINSEGHCALYLEYGKILTTFPKGTQWDGSDLPDKSMIVHRNLWEQGFRAGFRRRT